MFVEQIIEFKMRVPGNMVVAYMQFQIGWFWDKTVHLM